MYRTDFWTLWEKARVGCFKRTALKHVYYLGWNRSPAQVGCMRQVLGPGALGRPRGIGWRGRWEGRSGWGIHVYPWLIHVNAWQKPLQYCKVISLQLIKKKSKKTTTTWMLKKKICLWEVWNRLLDSVGEGEGGMFQENSIETCILSRVKQITSPGWMHETSAQAWYTGKTQRDGMGKEVGGRIGMGNTCKSMADSFQCMTKPTAIL